MTPPLDRFREPEEWVDPEEQMEREHAKADRQEAHYREVCEERFRETEAQA